MYKKQLGRRNLTEEQRTYMIGKMYEARKKTLGGDRKSNPQNAVLKAQGFKSTSEMVGKELGVSSDTIERSEQMVDGIERAAAIATDLNIGKSTVKRAEKFVKGVDAIRSVNPAAADNGK